jgi:surface carbohydrate biosynthesis protein
MRLRMLLLCDNVVRELESLRFLRTKLEKSLKAEVAIVGSVAEWERMKWELQQFQPHVVFMTQIQEQKCRELAEYVKASGAKVCVIPPETTLVKALQHLTVNPQLAYDYLIDFLFLPGQSLRELYRATDVKKSKIFVTGSPKIDILINQEGPDFYSREQFTQRFGIRPNKTNIFIFSSFRGYSKEYIKNDIAFTGVTSIANDESDFIDQSLDAYLEMLPHLCQQYPDYNFILKPHPLESSQPYRNIRFPNFYLIDQKLTLQACYKSADLVIHWNSTVAAECWLHHIKTIQYSPCTKYAHLLSELYHGNPLFTTYSGLVKGINRYLNSKMDQKYLTIQQQYLKDNYGNLKPDSSEKIASILKTQLEKPIKPVSYSPQVSWKLFFFQALERLLGVSGSRRLAHLYDKKYQWRYSIENYVNE